MNSDRDAFGHALYDHLQQAVKDEWAIVIERDDGMVDPGDVRDSSVRPSLFLLIARAVSIPRRVPKPESAGPVKLRLLVFTVNTHTVERRHLAEVEAVVPPLSASRSP